MSDTKIRTGRRPSVLTACALFLLAALALALLNFFAAPVYQSIFSLFPDIGNEAAQLILNLLFYLPFMLLPVFLCFRRRPDAADALRLKPITPKATLAVIITALSGIVPATIITALWSLLLEALGCSAPYPQMAIPTDTSGLILYFFAAAVLPGICEELLFRGVLLSGWERRGRTRAVLVSAMFFALLHGSVQGFPAEFLLGIVIGHIVTACDSIYAGMIYHTVHNAVILIMNFLSQRVASVSESAEMQVVELTIRELDAAVFQMIFYIALFVLMLRLFRRRAIVHGLQPALDTGIRCNAAELTLLAAGLLPIFYLYWTDISLMLGL